MGRVLYYCRINKEDTNNKGVIQKCLGIQKGFQHLGWETDIVYLSQLGIGFNDTIIYKHSITDDSSTFRNIIFNHLYFDRILASKIDFSRYRIFFIRYPLSHPYFILLLEKAKKDNPRLCIYLEVPTYPYCQEHSGLIRKIQQLLDKACRKLLKRYVDLTLNYGDIYELFGIHSIPLRNGVDVDSIPTSNSTSSKGRIRLIAVGNWSFWHGLDRLIEGLDKYMRREGNKTVAVELIVVGEGRELAKYQQMVGNSNLGDIVKFLAPLEGRELDYAFDQADIGVGCLGIFRKKVKLDSSLKHRQYCARGLPFILSALDPDFPPDLPWVHYVPSNEDPIDVAAIVQFYQQVKNIQDLRHKIRDYAIEHLSWSKKLLALPGIGQVDGSLR